MTKRTLHSILLYALLVALTALASACQEEPEPPVPEEPGQPELSRTVLVYQVAERNGLDRHSGLDIREMEQAVAEGQLGSGGRLLVYNHSGGNAPVLLDIRPDGTDTIKTYSTDLLSVQAERMLEVFDDMTAMAAAEEYGLILWGHGSGWLQDGIQDIVPTAPRSYGGENYTKWMNITTLAQTIEAGPDFSFVYFDCCHMASVEVAYEMRHATPLIAGCVSELPGEGMPYHLNVKNFFTEGSADIIAAATTTFRYYEEWKEIGRRPECSPANFAGRYATMSVIATEGLDDLADITADIYSRAGTSFPEGFVPQRFGRAATGLAKYYFDFGQYVEALCIAADGSERFAGASALLAEFRSALEACVPYAATMPYLYAGDADMKYHCGLSTYIVSSKEELKTRNYHTLEWYDRVVTSLTINN